MKVTVLQENLKQGLLIVSHAVGKNLNLPILSNILFKVSNGEIHLIGTNLELAIAHIIRGKVDSDGEVTVNAKLLSEYIGLIPNQKIELDLNGDNLSIKSANYKTKVTTQQSDDFPLVPEISNEINFKITSDILRKALAKVIFAVGGNDGRLEFTGVYLKIKDKEITLAATDGFRLAEQVIKMVNLDFEGEYIIPSKAIQEVVRILSLLGDGIDVEVCFGDGQVLFNAGDTKIVSKLIDGQYPDYKAIIPKETRIHAVLEKSELMRAIKIAAIFTKININQIKIEFSDSKVVVSSSSMQVGENTGEVQAEVSGGNVEVLFNYKNLIDGIQSMSGEKIIFDIANESMPCLMTCKDDDKYVYIVMPVK